MKLHNTKDMLLDAQKNHYAVPAFNIHNLETLSTVVETASELRSPVIIAATPSTVAYAGKDYLIALVGTAMEKYNIPMSFHLDHHEDVADIEDTVAAGCRSVMIDASKLPYEDNVKKVQKVVAFSHTCHATVEAELGRLVGQEDNVVTTEADKAYTNPDDAVRYVEETGIDKRVSIPLVLHGASDVPDELVEKAISLGITKVNIATDLKIPFANAVKAFFKEHPEANDPRKYMTPGKAAMKEVVKHKIAVCGSAGRA